ncbi:MAG: response regulator [Lachnospiraceae bacterium]|nr:response regulator [Lachnospiraceae bacterium]
MFSKIKKWFTDFYTKGNTIGYIIISVCIFMGLFAWMFFKTGGMNGPIPYLFVFGIVFGFLMYKGILLLIMVSVQTLFYIAVCWISYKYPEYVTPFISADRRMIVQMAVIILTAIGMGCIFLMYISKYRKQQKLAEDSSNAKSELLANISHEIRTPINMLLGMNEMIIRESGNPQINEYAQNVDSAGQHLLFLVNQFLGISRINMGTEVLFEENFNVYKMIESLGAFYGKEAEEKRLEFVMDIERKMPAYLYGDIRKLSQILSNLLSNAVKFTAKGNIVFSAHIVQREEGTYTLRFEVSDTGIGIPDGAQELIFENFERVDITKNRGIEGTGLGLSISNKLAELMGTRIQVESKYGVGSAFWIDVKLKQGDNEGARFNDQTGFFIAPEAKILAVDDTSMNLQVVKALLKRTMVSLDVAGSALESYDKYEKNDYDLVLMDYMMPEIDGISAMKHLREMDKARDKRTPIIVLTADASPEMREKFFEEGFDDYLLKPVESGILESVLLKHLPEKLVTMINSDNAEVLPEDTKAEFAALLKKYDVSLDMALKNLGGDVLQFARISKFFLNNTPDTIEKIKKYAAAKDYENTAILIHALKGNAGNVGGEDLFHSARRMEKRAKDKDEKYIVYGLPLFIMEWERVMEGLNCFLEEFEKIKHTLENNKDEENKLSEEELWDALLSAVRLGNQSPALKLIDQLEEYGKEKKKLEVIREHIKNIEFDLAEGIIFTIKR